jgi:hypothetical protein
MDDVYGSCLWGRIFQPFSDSYEIISYDTYKVRARAIDAQKTTG